MDSLQKAFGDTLQVISVTYDSEEKVKALFQKLKIPTPSFPMITADTLLNQLFPHQGDPYYIWVSNGKIAYLSNGWSLTYDNIKDILAGKNLRLTQRLPLPNYDYNETLLTPSLPLEEYSMLLTGLLDYHVASSIQTLTDSSYGEPYYLKAVNQSRLSLLIKAHWKEVFGFDARRNLHPNRFIVVDSSAQELLLPIDRTNEDDWKRENFFSYEVKTNPAEGRSLYKKMREDLAIYFPYVTATKTQLLPALVLEISDSLRFNKSKSSSNRKSGLEWKKSTIDINNLTLNNSIVTLLTESQLSSGGKLCINNTGYSGNINMTLPVAFDDLETMRINLSSYGLKLTEKNFPIKTILIKER
ncbi:MAG: hypothetical protein BGO52_11680 [Sphingobacteriales bacterium 44-61]|nr:MAG: hypothetical protein BGO52_11680 [Sphingobacteriales bacterium 44-61]